MTTTKTLSDFSTMYTFNSLDLIERMEELQEERLEAANKVEECGTQAGCLALEDWDKNNLEELKGICAVCDAGEEATSDWSEGVTCIRDSYFKDYAYGYAEDMGLIGQNIQWPHTCIDWDKAARELQIDYTSIEVNGVTFWVR